MDKKIFEKETQDDYSLHLGNLAISFKRGDKHAKPVIFIHFDDDFNYYKIGTLQGVVTLHWLCECLEDVFDV